MAETRNHSRTWCTTTTCGSREKAKRAYRRQLQKGRTQDPTGGGTFG